MGETDDDEPSTSIEGSDDGGGATLDASAPGGSSEDGDGDDGDDGGSGGGIGSASDEGRRGASYRCGSGVCVRTVAAHPILASRRHRRSGPQTNKHRETFVLVHAWSLFFSKMVNFMADRRRKYVCRSAVALVETHSLGVPFRSFSVFW